ncbi:MAG TPA: hypothetical protein VF794_25800 [Archangium sp.]|uniref:hypothetical protein n=1 Tax=Archangium sp. TaxID=1872627 RepID=UPI002ED829A3
MTPPQSKTPGKSLLMYVLAYALAISSIVLDIQRQGVLFTYLGFITSGVLTTILVHRMARAMALSPTAARLASVPVVAREQAA